jgi:hypothetical protein
VCLTPTTDNMHSSGATYQKQILRIQFGTAGADKERECLLLRGRSPAAALQFENFEVSADNRKRGMHTHTAAAAVAIALTHRPCRITSSGGEWPCPNGKFVNPTTGLVSLTHCILHPSCSLVHNQVVELGHTALAR